MPRSTQPKRHLAAEIAAAIRSGAYRSGEWLRQVDLEESLGATRFDIRAALAELALRQTVEHVPNRGFRVAKPDRQRLRDMLAVRALLECEAALCALPHLDEAALRLLGEKADAFDNAVAEGTTTSQSATNLDFHDTLYSFAPNRALVEVAAETRDRARLWPVVLWPSVRALRRSAEGHREILAALRAGNAVRVAESVRAHILGSAANDPDLDGAAPE
ncbi:GntR family transcriptional regulator [Pseudoroseomonas ludipueritiae]|uniref:GntR family transcriptional regulator n=1 Tax=Pseudoroseomonas ludipueritiae TaxID=198093 RepID=A0ABR7R290_9PROT|nr:GntR family transcriptional regulator [Pseudoroseomonas ludipueritiae]MBC9175848.1 GntR family transcriptional regulator [Pseudoroseomonas ludipueritiae]